MAEAQPPPPAAPPRRAGAVLLAGLGAACVAVYLVGVPNRVANPLWGLAVLAAGFHLVRPASERGLGALMLVAVAAAGVVASDLALRGLMTEKLYYRPTELLGERIPEYPFLNRFRPDTAVRHRSFGDLSAMRPPDAPRTYRDLEFVTDGLGFRNAPPPPGGYRAVILGDSFGYGSGVTQAETWAAVLGRDHGVPTATLAFPASPWQELMLAKAYLGRLPLAPGATVIWSLFSGNDWEGERGGLDLPAPEGVLGRAKARLATFRNRSPIRQLVRRSKAGAKAAATPPVLAEKIPGSTTEMLFYRHYIRAARMTPAELEATGFPAEFRRYAGALLAECQRRGLRLVAVAVPTKFEVYPGLAPGEAPPPPTGAFEALVRATGETAGFDVLALRPAMVAQAAESGPAPADLLWMPDDTHWSKLGHWFAAGEVARRWFPPPPKAP